jgi:hypothetical protein
MVTFDFVLDTVMQLPQEEQEDLIKILKKRKSHEWRRETAAYYNELKEEIDFGNIKSVSIKDAIADLHNYVNVKDNDI